MAARDLSNVIGGVLACARTVGREVPPGQSLMEYETALDLSLRESKLQFARQYPFSMPLDGKPDSGFRADFIVEGRVLLELAQAPALGAADTERTWQYLRASGADIGLLINFGREPVEIRRILASGEWMSESE